MLNLDTWKHK